ncbi:hypothetical protein F7734_31030 [Scytonema sp. UIC 10036]|uniref:hypothetical protein n=1 Tax=Scytonema sp. UIC 10036 TaxID=2304196 RepID=UPI0012DA5B04|nr:hypothetical protein [Scytonema sp. UIC 10036]MUG96534.1 hypothetical protein [Scytonema sp. UIC 10036]
MSSKYNQQHQQLQPQPQAILQGQRILVGWVEERNPTNTFLFFKQNLRSIVTARLSYY